MSLHVGSFVHGSRRLHVVGIALLYAYRAQGPTSPVVSYDKAVAEIISYVLRLKGMLRSR